MVRRVDVTPLRENRPPTMLDLPGGRVLAYHEYGDPAGAVVVNCHGGLVSGIDVEYSDDPARALGLRIISPNRPGVGGTSRRSGHRMLDWASEDLNVLLEHLQVDRFSVLGWSEGGQYALAVAHAFAHRVERVAVVAGALPLLEPGRLAELNANDRRLVKLARRAPLVARGYFLGSRWLARLSPRLLALVAVSALGPSDSELITTYSNWFARAMAESVIDTRGSVDEYLAFGSPWGFRPEDVAAPVEVFQGDADRVIPPAWSRALVARLPSATLHEYPDEGHFIALTRRAEVLSHLAPSARGRESS
ncbi:alpha/beta fold hydrolase [Subtercola sp. Z020]|uniref:alpha/beta fold hydrolase n=1 Tax=Subtercola sp. Z020 TaxID=2080582 RepID=UPI00130EA8BB|nr:alpha/beta hydrolase [Subtercola sp. Z020]